MLKQNGASQRKGVTGPFAREALSGPRLANHVSSTEAQAHARTALCVPRPQQPGARPHQVHSTPPGAGQKRPQSPGARAPGGSSGLRFLLCLRITIINTTPAQNGNTSFKVGKSGQSLDSGQSFMAWSSFCNKLNTESEKPQTH